MISLLTRFLIALSTAICFPAGAVAFGAQPNFLLSAGEEPGTYDLTAPPVPGRVYFFQMSADGKTWGYCKTVKLGTVGVPLKYTIALVSGQKHFFRLKYTESTTHTAGPAGDVDLDGWTNSAELSSGTDPFNPDSDYDGIPDGWELLYNLNPLFNADAALDSDSPNGDTLTNLQEFRLGSNPTQKDTDGDGLNDNVEIASGSNPAKFDLPELFLEYAWREATALDIRDYEAQIGRTLTGLISNSAESSGTPWSTTPPGGNTLVNVISTLNTMLGTQSGGTEVPYSAWAPWPGGAVARFRQTFRGDGVEPVTPLPVISHGFHRRDVKVRLRASRPMPVAWKIHLAQVRQSYTGMPGREWESVTVASNPVVLALGINQQETSYTVQITAPSDLANPGPPTAANPVNEFLVEYSLISNGTTVTPVSSGPLKDGDGDAITDAVELKIGTSTTNYSTNNNGVGDSDAKVSGIREPYLTLLSHRRSLYYSGSGQTATTTFSGNYAFNTAAQTDIIPGWPSLNGKLSAKGFPTTPPGDLFGVFSSIALLTRPPGTESVQGNSDATPPPGAPMGCIHADLTHKRTWGLLSIAPTANTTLNLLKVTSRKAKPGGTPVITTTSVALNFTAGARRSTNYIDLIPEFTSTNGELVQVALLNPEIKPDANMAGVIGDTVPSSIPGSTVKHFVTPKQTPELNQPNVILRASGMTAAQLTAGHADQVVAWEVTPAANRQADDNPLLCRIKRSTAGRTEVKLKTKAGNTVLAQTNVWVVWATGAPPVEIPITSTRDPEPTPGITVRGGYNFTFNVQPAILFSDAERPHFSPREGVLPGKNVDGQALDGGVQGRWDVSRQIRGKYVGMASYAGVKTMTNLLPSVFPSNPIEGNDDANTVGETYDPQANEGNLTSRDVPARGWIDLFKPEPTDTPAISWKLHFREFARLQINSKWYLISDYQLWRFHVTIFHNRIWNNLSSDLKLDHADW